MLVSAPDLTVLSNFKSKTNFRIEMANTLESAPCWLSMESLLSYFVGRNMSYFRDKMIEANAPAGMVPLIFKKLVELKEAVNPIDPYI